MKNKLTLKTIEQSDLVVLEMETVFGGAARGGDRCIGLYNRDGQLVDVYCNYER